jgi:tyrosyl-tRNA synthetase
MSGLVQIDLSPELQAKYDAIRSVGEECINENELKALLVKKVGEQGSTFNLYDGFEPSGRVHIAQGAFKAINVNKCTSSNGVFIFWVADWFALMNDKMGGDLDKIKVVGQYLIEVWTAAGMDMSDGKVVFKWASDEITNNASTYWPKMLDIARRFNITRIKKCCQIMGRLEGNLTAAQILYPLMQCTDVFFLKADICQLGVDQRKVNMLAREYCEAAKIKFKPVILSHHMLYGLKAGQEKMSKSDPDSAIFMEDTPEDVERKILAAYCPSKPPAPTAAAAAAAAEATDAGKESMSLVVDELKNPCLDYIKYIVLTPPGSTFDAGGKVYTNFEEVKADFVGEKLSEADLKASLVLAINQILQPVRDHFNNDANAKALLEKVQSYKKETITTDRKFRRNVLEGKTIPENAHVVFVPAPDGNPSFQLAIDILTQLKAVPAEQASSRVLFLSDWSATVASACDADPKVLNANFNYLLKSLKAIAPEVMEGVVIVKQSEAILVDPSMYWISVINVGRFFNLNTVQEGYEDSKAVGHVIARLMLVADALSMSPKSISFIVQDEMAAIEANIIVKYFTEAEIPLPMPTLVPTQRSNIALVEVAEAAHITENYEYFLLDDPKVNGKAKMKKSFCEPGNLNFCPPIVLASVFALKFGSGELAIQRSDENGGNVTYTTEDQIRSDFESGALHPGDLKAAVSTVMFGQLEKLSVSAKADKDWEKDGKCLKAYNKQAAKKK